MKDLIEVELKASITPDIEKQLLNKAIVFQTYIEADQYYRFISIPMPSWVVRIRRKNKDYFLTYKSNKKHGEGSWSEVEIKISKNDAKRLHNFFIKNEYSLDVKIDKQRKSFKQGRMVVNIDSI